MYSYNSNARLINEYLCNIKPPDNFRIHARSLFERAYWKASEYRAWLLYYSLPILIKILPGDYVHHYALLRFTHHLLLARLSSIFLLLLSFLSHSKSEKTISMRA